ncbi:hypothetical protein [Aquihabitans sp. McL0605]|uniref:hypothetical protein n=1 Tax=Aquihabitans sp. McL0605 TaxID=3415671 RepID=UPI003CF7F5F8
MLLALSAGPVASDALDGRSTPVVASVATWSWLGWTAALVAMLLPRTSSLTVVRVLVPAGWMATIAAVAVGDDITALDALALVAATGALVFALAPWVTDTFVDGSSYGPERRIALRTPLVLTLLATITEAVVVLGASVGILLLASRQWAAGAAGVLLGAAVVFLGVRSIHQLSRRWLVLVPTGMVIHDPLVMPEPQLFLRQTMARLGPAETDADEALVTQDLTAGASGLVLSLTLSEPVELLVPAGRGETTLHSVDRVLFSPALPTELLAEGRKRRLPVA